MLVLGVPAPFQVGCPEDFDYWPSDVEFPDSETHDYNLPQQRMQEIASKFLLPFLILRPPLIEVREQQPYFANNWHWTEVGHQAIAKYLQVWFGKQVGELSEASATE